MEVIADDNAPVFTQLIERGFLIDTPLDVHQCNSLHLA
jgi:hypothetical protein